MQKVERTEEEAIKEATEEFLKKLSEKGIEDIISLKTESLRLTDDSISVTVFAECEEELGIEKTIQKSVDQET